MARKTLNRMDLRRAAEAAADRPNGETDAPGNEKPARAVKPPKVSKPRKSAKNKAPVRMRVRWAVVNDSLKQVAVFDYPQRDEADQKAADLIQKGRGHHFVRAIKEPMPEVAAVVE